MDEILPSDRVAAEAIPKELVTDQTFAVLADSERRYLLAILPKLKAPERLSALTRILAVAIAQSGAIDVGDLHARLTHNHVPRLKAAGFVSYDEENGTVELTVRGELLADCLDP